MKTIENSHQKAIKPSLARWWRQIKFIPILHNQWINANVKRQLTQAVTQAEKGHRGEVLLIIENHLPSKFAYRFDCRQRAINLFSHYRVWDTQENTGVLVYVNICERDLEIIADRGINQHVSPEIWQAMCNKAVTGLADKKIIESLTNLLAEIGQLLRQYYALNDDPSGNELPDNVIFIK